MSFKKIADESDFKNTPLNKYDLAQLEITIVKYKDKYYAFEDRCPHMNSPLHLGELIDDHIICPFHKAQFNIVSGKKERDPKIPIPKFIKMGNLMHKIKTHDLKTINVRVEKGEILVDI
jgi:nitrite reductase/ring-hydroxylating ferredoxin subunit